jgi:hypothetical protein
MSGLRPERPFDNALNEALVGIYYPEQLASPEDQETIGYAYRMADQPFTPDPGWSAQLRARLVERAHRELPTPVRNAARPWRHAPLIATAGTLALMLLFVAVLSWIVQDLRPPAPSILPAIALASPTARGTLPPAPTAQSQPTAAPEPAAGLPSQASAMPAPTHPGTAPPVATVTPTPKKQLTPDQLGREFNQLHAAIYSLDNAMKQANTDRARYAAFLTAQQSRGMDTHALEASLTNFDSYMAEANAGRSQARSILFDRSVFDASGQVIHPEAAQAAIDAMLKSYNQERYYMAAGVFELHSALNLYGQVWGVAVPNIHELDLAPFALDPNYGAEKTPNPNTPASNPTATSRR